MVPLHVAKALKTNISRKDKCRIRLAQGFAQTIGSISFPLTINQKTRRVTALVINGFQYSLLMSLETCGLFDIVIDTRTRRAILPDNHCLHINSSTAAPDKRHSPEATLDQSVESDPEPRSRTDQVTMALSSTQVKTTSQAPEENTSIEAQHNLKAQISELIAKYRPTVCSRCNRSEAHPGRRTPY